MQKSLALLFWNSSTFGRYGPQGRTQNIEKLTLWWEIHSNLTKTSVKTNNEANNSATTANKVWTTAPPAHPSRETYFARFSSWPLLELIQILLNPFEPDSRQQLENKVRLVDLLNGISNVTSRHQKGPSSIVIRWIFNKHIICSWQPKRARRGGLAVFITGTMSHYRFCFWLALKVTLLLSLLFPDYWWNNVVIFLHMVMGYKQQQRLYILNATMLFPSTTSSFFLCFSAIYEHNDVS